MLKAGKLNDPKWVSDITMVCCALHNMCERQKSFYDDIWFPTDSMQRLYLPRNLRDPADEPTETEDVYPDQPRVVRAALKVFVHDCDHY